MTGLATFLFFNSLALPTSQPGTDFSPWRWLPYLVEMLATSMQGACVKGLMEKSAKAEHTWTEHHPICGDDTMLVVTMALTLNTGLPHTWRSEVGPTWTAPLYTCVDSIACPIWAISNGACLQASTKLQIEVPWVSFVVLNINTTNHRFQNPN